MPTPEQARTSPPTPPESAARDDADRADQPELTPEEQMEQFEESLKENDWGHQPC